MSDNKRHDENRENEISEKVSLFYEENDVGYYEDIEDIREYPEPDDSDVKIYSIKKSAHEDNSVNAQKMPEQDFLPKESVDLETDKGSEEIQKQTAADFDNDSASKDTDSVSDTKNSGNESGADTGETADKADDYEEIYDSDADYSISDIISDNDMSLDDNYDVFFTKKHIIAALVIFLLAVIFVLFSIIDDGIVGSFKKSMLTGLGKIFNTNMHTISTDNLESSTKDEIVYTQDIKSSFIIPFDGAALGEFCEYKGGLVCAKSKYMVCYKDNGIEMWSQNTDIVDPLLSVSDEYILLAQKGGKKAALYSGQKLVYSVNLPDNIQSAKISSAGDAVFITEKASYKGAVVVINKNGDTVFSWASGAASIISADISPKSRRVAAALLNTESRVYTDVQLFDINKEKSYAAVKFEDSLIFDVKFLGDTLNCIGDNSISLVSSKGKLIANEYFNDVDLIHYAYEEGGNKLLLFDNGNIPYICRYNSLNVLKESIKSEQMSDFVAIRGKYMLFNSGRSIIFDKFGSKELTKFIASMDIKKLIPLNSSAFAVVYSNSIEIVTV